MRREEWIGIDTDLLIFTLCKARSHHVQGGPTTHDLYERYVGRSFFFCIDVDLMERLSRDRGKSHDGSHMTAVT